MKKSIPTLWLVLLVSCSTGKGFEPVVLDLSSAKAPTPTPPAGTVAGPTPSPTAIPAPLSREAPASAGGGRDSRTDAPEAVVASRAEAYERGDIPALLALYAADAQIYDPPDRLRDSGLDQIRQSYARDLTSSSGARATVSQRMSEGRYVVERERGAGPGEPAIVIYEVRGGQIARTWILR